MRKAKLITYYLFTCFRTAPVFSGKNYMYILLPFLCSLLFALCSLFPAICSAQQSITWQRVYDGPAHRDDAAYDICQSTDGNFYITGSTNIGPTYAIIVLKLNGYGDTLWSKIIGGIAPGQLAYSIAPSADGGCVLTGDWNPAFSIKLSATGNIVWQKFYGGSFIQCYDIIRTSDGGYIACGSDVNINSDGYAFKIDSLGNLQWQRIYPSNLRKIFWSVTDALDGGYVLAGDVEDYSSDTLKAYILKVDENGNEIWEKRFRINNYQTGFRVIEKIPNSYLIGGSYTPGLPNSVAFFITTDLNGNITYTKTFQDTISIYLNDIKIIRSDRLVICLQDYDNRTKVLITDFLGNTIRGKIFYNGNYSILSKTLPLLNGDIVFAGRLQAADSQYFDIYCARTDSMLNAPPIGIKPGLKNLPAEFKLHQNYPNPFNSSTTIKYEIAFKTYAELKIFDVLGREIETLVNEESTQGVKTILWKADNYPSGVYLYRLIVNGYSYSKKLVLIN